MILNWVIVYHRETYLTGGGSKDMSLELKSSLLRELHELEALEAAIDNEIVDYFEGISSNKSISLVSTTDDGGTTSTIASDLCNSLTNTNERIVSFNPFYEAMTQESKKLAVQINECCKISDRMSSIVRRLDLMQMHAQEALACTEDIMNLKECKIKMKTAIDEGNLPLAVSIVRQVQKIDIETAKACDDYGVIQNQEKDLRVLVQREFSKAMEVSDIKGVMILCPLLQTLGLEVEARDEFINFIERTVFIAVSADAVTIQTNDAATGYAQALSNIFNSTYLILQQYLPIVLQGMESSYGDIYFIRRLHSKCEKEAGILLKRYMKYRNTKELIPTSTSTNSKLIPSDLHVILDELALLIQYCCTYSKYLKKLCASSEERVRATTSGSTKMTVFSSTTDFDKMVDELINRYYFEGESWLLKSGVRSVVLNHVNDDSNVSDQSNTGLDECFFVLQRCSHRAIATNNIHAACAVLHLINDVLNTELLNKANDLIGVATTKICNTTLESLSKYLKSTTNATADDEMNLAKGVSKALSLVGVTNSSASSSLVANEDDPYGVADYIESFNTIETISRYIDRFNRDVGISASSVFVSDVETDRLASPTAASANNSNKNRTRSVSDVDKIPSVVNITKAMTSNELDKLSLCKEDFDRSKQAYLQLLKSGYDTIVGHSKKTLKDIIFHLLGKNGPYGGVKFDLSDDRFDGQPALSLYPRLLTLPFETLISVCTTGLSETNKDNLVALLADASCERLEQFIMQSTFRFAGSLKLEECVRAITTLFTRASSVPIRGKFSRLREILVILTHDSSTNNLVNENFTHLTMNEVKYIKSLRVDS